MRATVCDAAGVVTVTSRSVVVVRIRVSVRTTVSTRPRVTTRSRRARHCHPSCHRLARLPNDPRMTIASHRDDLRLCRGGRGHNHRPHAGGCPSRSWRRGVSAATSASCIPSRLVAARTAEMGTVSVSDVSFDESESAVMTAIKATHAITRASATLRLSQEGEEAVAQSRRRCPRATEIANALGCASSSGRARSSPRILLVPLDLWVSLPQRRSFSPRRRSPAPRSQLDRHRRTARTRSMRPDDDPTGRWIRQLAGDSGVGGRARRSPRL